MLGRCADPAHVALVGTFAPRKCGIATFTADIFEQLGRYHPEISLDVYALDAPRLGLSYRGVRGVIAAESQEDYRRAARAINASGADAVWLQHEFGIFGGPDGAFVNAFVDDLAPPLVLTLHTVLAEPSPRQRDILVHLIGRASRVMVMSRYARDLLIEFYGAPADTVRVIPHGAPDRPFGRTEKFKEQFGLAGRDVLMTFGLISPGKGLERVIEALPAIIGRHPNVLYRIVGATHPNLLADQGEAYRESLVALARRLGVDGSVSWENRFLDTPRLLDHLEASDIYITPYFNLQQATSGTLSYAVALGKSVVATPYVHARELLADGVGTLIEPNSSAAIAAAVTALLDDRNALETQQRRAYDRGRATIWPEFAAATARLLRSAIRAKAEPRKIGAAPNVGAVIAMSDSTGMLQHSISVVPDRRHGYCLDDNARALMLMNVADHVNPDVRMTWALRYASFVQHAWNADLKRFRNFMGFDRAWLEERGSDDSNGRAIWALGHTAAHAPSAELRRWGLNWFEHVAGIFEDIDAARASAFALLGAACILGHRRNAAAARVVETAGARLHAMLLRSRRGDWNWFEPCLAYDNARLPQALIEAGLACKRPEWAKDGLDALRWLTAVQTAPAGHFRPVGSDTFGRPYDVLPFDQQPLEALATIEAALCADRASGDAAWRATAAAAFRWYLGDNDRGVILGDISTGRCRDGVTPRGANENCGAESILSFQLAQHAISAFDRDQPDWIKGEGSEPAPHVARESVSPL